MYITTEGVKSESRPEDTSKITMQATGALSWRKADVKYRKNEAFVDVIEDVNLLVSATGSVLRADVTGQIIMRAYLSGTPECKFGLNDRLLLDNDGLLSLPSGNKMGTKATKAAAGSVTLEDCQFHQCVKLGKFDSDRIISFVPPDGEFELMRYRATENVNLPFKVHVIVNEIGRTKVEYSIGVKANFGSKLFATNVIIKIPTPLNTAKITERCTQGKAKYEPSENVIVWKIGRFTGQSEYVLTAEASLTSMTNQRAWSRPPLSMNFSLLMFTSSGLLVRYLKVFEKSNYSSVKWVRYMTRAGSYEIRHVPKRRSRQRSGSGRRRGRSIFIHMTGQPANREDTPDFDHLDNVDWARMAFEAFHTLQAVISLSPTLFDFLHFWRHDKYISQVHRRQPDPRSDPSTNRSLYLHHHDVWQLDPSCGFAWRPLSISPCRRNTCIPALPGLRLGPRRLHLRTKDAIAALLTSCPDQKRRRKMDSLALPHIRSMYGVHTHAHTFTDRKKERKITRNRHSHKQPTRISPRRSADLDLSSQTRSVRRWLRVPRLVLPEMPILLTGEIPKADLRRANMELRPPRRAFSPQTNCLGSNLVVEHLPRGAC